MSIESKAATGRDSVPLPPSPWTPESICQWCRNRDEAEAKETAPEACDRAAQEMRDLGLHDLYSGVLSKLLAQFDRIAASQEMRGLSLEECGPVNQYGLEELLDKWRAASKAMSRLDRDRFQKFAADVAARITEIVDQYADANASKGGD
jgi:hypothetical protein